MVQAPSAGGHGQQPSAVPNKPVSMRQTNAPSFPYSARREYRKFDLSTVIRKGDPQARDLPPRQRIFGLQEAPSYRPTEVEWEDPMAYIKSIAEEASRYGICKIIPPDSWNPPFAIDAEKFHFQTRKQEINLVEGQNRQSLAFLDSLSRYHKQFGQSLIRYPSVDKKPLDLFLLKRAVETHGGFHNVCKDKKWAEIGRSLGYSGKIMSSLSTSLKNSYQRWIEPYERYLKNAMTGGQQADFDQQGPSTNLSPSPAKSAPPRLAGSPAVQASKALHASIDSPHPSIAPPTPAPTTQSLPPSGFQAVNGSGFAAVNSPAPPQQIPQVKHEHPPLSQSMALSLQPGQDGSNGHASTPTNALKRTISQEVSQPSDQNQSNGTNGHREKRPRQDSGPNHPTVSMTPSRSTKSAVRRNGDKCEICQQKTDTQNILLCDTCDLGYHIYCEPSLQTIPQYEWHCPKCLMTDSDFGFCTGDIYSLKSFQDKVDMFKDNYFASKLPRDPVTGHLRRPNEDEVEREFWRLVEDINETVEVEYGADIHSSTHSSGFPCVETDNLNPYSRSPWNLNVLPFHNDSLFRHIKGDISGMTVPWLYVGQVFSTFCWHVEDHYAYSANYQHFGAVKTWYGIPASDADKFEVAMREAIPELFEAQPDLLYQLVTILPPGQLRKKGVNVYALDQRAGQFVITFPRAFHAGFNHGFNFNEAVNFAPADWEEFGDQGVQALKKYRKPACFSHDELLYTAATCKEVSISTAQWLAPAIRRVVDRELDERDEFRARHQEISPHANCEFDTLAEEIPEDCGLHIIVDDSEMEEEDYQCFYCKAFCFFSRFRCQQSRRVSCLKHSEKMDCCSMPPDQRLHGPEHVVIVYSLNADLDDLVRKIESKANVPVAWQKKLDKLLLDETQPPLKSLQLLLAEGERIDSDFALPGLADLTDFVSKCNAWVEEANAYVTRKQQNRKKNEKAWRRSSTKPAKPEEKEPDPTMTIERMKELIAEGEELSFAAPQLDALRERLVNIEEWTEHVRETFSGKVRKSCAELEGLLEEGRTFNIDIPELTNLDKLHQRAEWSEQVEGVRADIHTQGLDACKELLQRAIDLGIIQTQPQVQYLQEMVARGELWELKAKEIMAAEDIHYAQLEALQNQVAVQSFPVNKDILSQMDVILAKNREAKKQIMDLVEQSQKPNLEDRPKYVDVRDVIASLQELNGKPHGAMELEKLLKTQESWMRNGKKLFGKSNAPLSTLMAHMKYVEARNDACFEVAKDTPRGPVEPSSREASPSQYLVPPTGDEFDKPLFCLCRLPEAGMMIQCETYCQDWYHSKCLKLARAKMKMEEFTCPVCDYRVNIPREAARPKLEDLIAWQDQVDTLPFQPEEKDLLESIVNKAQDFRTFLTPWTNGSRSCQTEDDWAEMTFYLRKILGGEILLAYETNVFRQELHKFKPVAPTPPPILEQSLSTRKPRPTKIQRLLKEHGVSSPDQLPAHLQSKAQVRKKASETFPTGTLMPRPSDASAANSPRSGNTGMMPGSMPKFGETTVTLSRDYSNSPSPLFSPSAEQPTAIRDAMVSAALARQSTSHADPSFPMFRNNADVDDLRTGLAGPIEGEAEQDNRSQAENDFGELFREMTNGDEDEPAHLGHEESQATEALEIMSAGQQEVSDAGDKSVGLEVAYDG